MIDYKNYKAPTNGVTALGFLLRIAACLAITIVLGIDLESIK